MPDNSRVIYSIRALGFAPLGSNTYNPAHGVQTCTINTNFNLEDVFELSQAEVYQIIEDIPDIQVSCSKVLDGYSLLYHLATFGATSNSIAGRGSVQCSTALSIFKDTQDNASGTPLTECICSGLFFNSATYTFPVDGNATEEITLVGNNKVYRTSGFTFSGATLNSVFNGLDSPAYGTVVRREHFDFGDGRTLLPPSLPGISSSGVNNSDNLGNYKCSVQNVSVSFDLGRENLNELGHKGPYFKVPNPVVDVTTTIDIVNKSGDMKNVYANAANLSNERILIKAMDSTQIDCGSKNKLQSINENGGDAGGSFQTLQFVYVNKNRCAVSHSGDPSGL